jgi:predicted nucleic acid-binding protein
MVLVDTSVWVRHFRRADPSLQALLAMDGVLCHPLVLVELACGSPPSPRAQTLADLRSLRQAVVATHDETLSFIEQHALHDKDCGAVDLMLLAATVLTRGAALWTNDRSLHALALRMGVAFETVKH